MRVTILTFLFTLVLKIHSKGITDGSSNAHLEGSHCPIKEHPYLVGIVRIINFRFVCAGTLLSKNFVLTAASCLNPVRCTQRSYNVIAGANVVKPDSVLNPYAQISQVVDCFSYSDQDSDIVHNIAIIKLKTAIMENFEIKYVKLATNALLQETSLHETCKNGTVMGWNNQIFKDSGRKFDDDDDDESAFIVLLQCNYIPVLYFDECKKYFAINKTINIFCAHGNASTVCHGDAGGPFICNDIQFGILSNGWGCNADHPAAYTMVYQYTNFIQKYVSGDYDKSFGNLLKINIYLHFLLFILVVHLNKIFGF